MRLRRVLVVGLVGFLGIQLVPYGWSRPNPRVISEAPWPSAAAADVARAACYACHSNETHWPVYAYVAPMSWLVRRDVESGRDELNFSEWDRHSDARDAADAVAERTMPPSRYVRLHADARLSARERQLLIDALDELNAANDSGGSRRGRG